MFIDRVTVHLRAGAGGAGVVSFRRIRGKPKGKPEGGSGGAGGNVVIQASAATSTLLAHQRNPHRAAGSGGHGSGDLRHGRRGEDLVLDVPCGTVVRDSDGVVIADLVEDGQRVQLLEGGRGGRGNAALVSPAHRAPRFCEQGEFGESGSFELELRLIADAAIVGYPNAGKSTLISVVSAARPKIADYPFTTIEPHLGVVSTGGREFVLADVPGLIEGAAVGKGLGREFLRHVMRSRAILYLLDPTSAQEIDIAEQYSILSRELADYAEELAERPRVVAVNKVDVADMSSTAEELQREIGIEVHRISAVRGDGLDHLMHAVADAAEEAERTGPDREGFVLHRPAGDVFEVSREGETWLVRGRSAERAVGLADLTIPEAADYAAERLTRLGVDEALRAAGAQPGDEVRIGELSFEFWEEDPNA